MADSAAAQAVYTRFFENHPSSSRAAESTGTDTAARIAIFERFFAAPVSPESLPAQGSDQGSAATDDNTSVQADAAIDSQASASAEQAAAEPSVSFFTRMKKGLSRTRSSFSEGMANLLIGKKELDDELFDDIETQLLVADVGIDATKRIMNNLTERVGRRELADSGALYAALQEELCAILGTEAQPFTVDTTKAPYVVLVVGVNGVGKTTTIGKLAMRLQQEGKSVMLAAGDTFRAAAVEQLQVWGHRNDIPVVAQHTGADSASVIFDALQAAKSRGVDVLIADTAGRLHNKSNLMEELSKVKRVVGKLDDSAPHEVMLVLDAGTGQNALNQAEMFDKAVGVTGITLTKLDGTAKGGILFSLAEKTALPIRFVGIGEGIDDLRPFEPEGFVAALFANDD